MKKLGLYIHIPFCKQKCNYCDFYSLGCQESKIPSYIDALCNHIEREAHLYSNYEFDTIFLGGGTPSLIEPKDFEKLAKAIKCYLKITQGAEFSIEANPCTLTKEKLNCYKSSGVSRISIGLQSTSDSELKCLGRIHDLEKFKESYLLARECGIDNINIDIMYGLPNQSLADFSKTIREVCEFAPEHISAYCLKIEENTPFYKMRNSLILPNDDEEYEMYMYLCSELEKQGYEQYEISNFSKKGARCVHNLKYWLSEEYIGIGPSAHSYFNGQRYFYEDNVDNYINDLMCVDKCPTKHYEEKTSLKENSKDEYVMLKMRLSDGINVNEYKQKFGCEFIVDYPRILDYIENGYVKEENEEYSFTPKGFFVSNYILTQILNFS